MRKFAVLVLCGVCLLTPSLSGQVPEKKPIAAKDKKPAAKDDAAWTVDDIVNAEEASAMRISPDCKWVAWIKRAPDKEKNELVGHLMLSSLTEAKEIQLTRGTYSASQPQWSPDGKLLAFLSARPAPKSPKAKREDDEKDEPKDQVWLINPFGGEPWVLTQSPRDIKHFAWSDSDTIIYVAQEKIGRLESELKEKKDDAQVVDDEPNEPPVRLWKKAVKDKEKKAERLTDNADRISSLALSPDGRFAVTVHERSLSFTFDNKIRPVVYLYDLETKQRTQIFSGPKFNISQIAWQLDGKGFYAVNQFTTSPRYLHAFMLELRLSFRPREQQRKQGRTRLAARLGRDPHRRRQHRRNPRRFRCAAWQTACGTRRAAMCDKATGMMRPMECEELRRGPRRQGRQDVGLSGIIRRQPAALASRRAGWRQREGVNGTD